MKRGTLLFLALGFVLLLAGSCAPLPPQTRPADPSPFVGRWTGSWTSDGGRGFGEVDVTIRQIGRDQLSFWANLTNAVAPGFGRTIDLRNGELVYRSDLLDMTFRLYGETRLEAEYDNKRIGDRGRWSLSKVPAR